MAGFARRMNYFCGYCLLQMGSSSSVPFVNIFTSLFVTVVVPILCGQVSGCFFVYA